MSRRRLAPLAISLVACAALGGCATPGGGAPASVVKLDTRQGREWETGMSATSQVLRPFSKGKDAAAYSERASALTGYGALIDLLGR